MPTGPRLRPSHVAHLFGVWLVLAAIVGTFALNRVLAPHYLSFWSTTAEFGYQFAVGPGLLVLAGFFVARRSTRPWVVAVGTLLVVVASISVNLGCGTTLCQIPPEYERWRHVRIAVQSGLLGPKLVVSTEPSACGFRCGGTYAIQLAPLAAGFGLIGAVLSPESSVSD